MRKLLAALLTMLFLGPAHAGEDLSNEFSLIESWLGAQRAYDNVPGLSAAVAVGGDVAWSNGFGQASLDTQQPARANTIYGICSISKVFTGIAVMQLRDAGKFGLDDPLPQLLPWFELEQSFAGSPDITLRAVLTHSAGLPRESDYPYWMPPDFPFPENGAIRERLAEQSTIYPADRYYQYSNLGLSLAGEVVARHSGMDYEGYVRSRILEPIGLEDTDTGFPEDARAERIATGYSYPGRDQQLKPMPRYDTRGITPAAGFASTATDLAKFAAWQFRTLDGEEKVLAANTLREMQRAHWLDWDWGVARGLSFGVYRVGNRTLSGHGGDCPGFNTRLYTDPVARVAVSMMANRNRVDVGGYAAAVFDIMDGGGTTEDEPQAKHLDDFVGRYDLSPWDGEVMVFRWKDTLATISVPTMDPAGSMTLLKYVDGDRFHTVRDDGQPGHELRFSRNEQGKVSRMHVHSMALPRF